MKKIIVLGAGHGQIPFIRICKKIGCYVIVIGLREHAPGFELADKVYYIDIKEKDFILDIARKEKIDAILSDQSDYAVPTIAYVSEKMGLRTIGYERALNYTNKYRMRVNARLGGINVPRFFKTKEIGILYEEARKLTYPLIMKPVDSAGSRGIHKIDSEKGLAEAFFDSSIYSTTGEVIVEEYICGKEYIVDGFGLNDQYINLDIGEKQYFDKKDTYISKMCMFTSANMITDENEKRVLDVNKRLVSYFGLPYGITHAEYILENVTNKVYLVEIAARGGGIYLSSDLTPRATGIPTNELLVEYILNGENKDIGNFKLEKKVTAWICFELVPGTISKISGISRTCEIKGVFKVCLDNLYIGKKILPMINDLGKYGPILIEADSREMCRKIMIKVKETLNIETTDINGKSHGVIW